MLCSQQQQQQEEEKPFAIMIIILKGFARVFEHKRDLNYAAKRFMQQKQQQQQQYKVKSQRIAVILAKAEAWLKQWEREGGQERVMSFRELISSQASHFEINMKRT